MLTYINSKSDELGYTMIEKHVKKYKTRRCISREEGGYISKIWKDSIEQSKISQIWKDNIEQISTENKNN